MNDKTPTPCPSCGAALTDPREPCPRCGESGSGDDARALPTAFEQLPLSHLFALFPWSFVWLSLTLIFLLVTHSR